MEIRTCFARLGKSAAQSPSRILKFVEQSIYCASPTAVESERNAKRRLSARHPWSVSGIGWTRHHSRNYPERPCEGEEDSEGGTEGTLVEGLP